MMNSNEIEHGLTRLGFDVNVDKVRIHSAYREDMENPVYIKTPSSKSKSGVVNKAPLVVHSGFLEGLRMPNAELDGIDPITSEFFHNSNMEDFPTRMRTGDSPTHYGIAVNVRDSKALANLVNWLSGVSSTVKRVASALEDIENAESDLESVRDTERQSIVKSRLGQGKFRDDLLDHWSGCAVSGVTLPAFLRASHIKPWRDCTNSERLDKYNGLLLNTNLDAAFDRGFISFSDDGGILISAALEEHAAELSISKHMSLKSIDDRHLQYLDWHRRHVFDSTQCQIGFEDK